MVWRMLNAEKDRMRESLEDASLPVPNSCLSLVIDLFAKFHDPSHVNVTFPTDSAINSAIAICDTFYDTGNSNPYNLSHHFTALASMVLVEALKTSERRDEVLMKLQELNQVFLNGQMKLFMGDRWITPLKNFLAASIQHHLGGSGAHGLPSGPDRAGLQHLADAAVGETETGAGVSGISGSRRGSGEYSAVAPKGYLTMLARFV